MGKAVLAIVIAVIVIVALVMVLTFWISARMYEDHQRTCSPLGARVVSTGRGHFLCVTPDGRVVRNG